MNTSSKDKKSSTDNSTSPKPVKDGHKSYESTQYQGSEVSNKYGSANKEEDIKNASRKESK